MKENTTSIRHSPVELAIIGGGAAGLFAAAECARRRVGCLVFERKARIGSKMLLTANGRCNFTKAIPAARMLADIGEPCAAFLRTALERLPPAAVERFFREAGVRVKRMTDGRLFPASEKAADIVHVFGDILRERGVPIAVNCPVTGIAPVKNGFIVATAGFTVWAKHVLVATGGASFPKTGSVGDGYSFARELGHTVEPLRAGLTGFDVRAPRPVRWENAEASIGDYRWRGEVEFDRFGLTGAAVYNCQRYAARRNLADFTLQLKTPDGELEYRSPRMRPLKDAIVTIGGVSLAEIDPATMESRRVPGLYFAGEVCDLDGPTGGYNLTIAFATAALAVAAVSGGGR